MVPPIKRKKNHYNNRRDTVKGINSKLDTRYFRAVKDGQLRLVFFSAELTKEEGIKDIINALYIASMIMMDYIMTLSLPMELEKWSNYPRI